MASLSPPKQGLGNQGAYLLFIHLEQAVRIGEGGMRGALLPPGLYAYAGSAKGPGGIEARLARHLRRPKRAHWHVDHLTNRAASIETLAFAGGSECRLMESLLALAGVTVPVPGFGSSDCTRCKAHLARLPEGFDLNRAKADLRQSCADRAPARSRAPANRRSGSGGKA